MATDSILPLYYNANGTTETDVDLDELLNNNVLLQDEEFLIRLLESGSAPINDLPTFPGTHVASPSSSDANLRTSLTTSLTTYDPDGSPVSTGYVSDHSVQTANSPVGSYCSYLEVPASSPSDLVSGLCATQWDELTARHSGDVSINLESDVSSTELLSSAPSDLKVGFVRATDEERKLLAEEGIILPTDMALTKTEQKHLKRIRRKIKNKISAQESRRRKKDYVEGLEQRVEKCTEVNRVLESKVTALEAENRSLLSQLKKLQALLSRAPVQSGTFVMVLVFSFSMFFIPTMQPPSLSASPHSSVPSRTLLFTETDEFGNIIDPETGLIISEAGHQSPPVPLPWEERSPAWNLWGAEKHDNSQTRQIQPS